MLAKYLYCLMIPAFDGGLSYYDLEVKGFLRFITQIPTYRKVIGIETVVRLRVLT